MPWQWSGTVVLRDLFVRSTALQWRTPALTRRRSTDAREDCWHIYYRDVHAGTIAMRNGNPHDTDPWQWSCGFYPGSHPGEHQDGTAATFDEARADFEQAWTVFLSKRSEADLQAWRDQQAWTAEGERMPPNWKPSHAAAG